MSELTLTAAVFAHSDQLILIRLEDDDSDRATADAASRGYSYAGCIAVNRGTPKVTIEPGYEAAIYAAGILFSEMLGKETKRYQGAN